MDQFICSICGLVRDKDFLSYRGHGTDFRGCKGCLDGRFKPLTYLACPYTYVPDPGNVMVKESRFIAATNATSALVRVFHWNVFSPITHSHPLHVHGGMRGDWDFWRRIDEEFLLMSARIVTVAIPGWRESKGVADENKIAEELGLPQFYMTPVEKHLGDEPGEVSWSFKITDQLYPTGDPVFSDSYVNTLDKIH
jgi:hypothetical protein